MKEKNEDQIYIVTGIGENQEQMRAERGIPETVDRGFIHSISVSTLKKNMVSFFGHLQEILDTGTATFGLFEVDQVQVAAQVSADGKVCLFGSGAQLGVRSGITFVLKRKQL